MKHGWTGGQYSVWRVLLGGALAIHYSRRACIACAMSDAPATALVIACAETVLCIAVALGVWHRAAALLAAAAIVLFQDPSFGDRTERSFMLAALLVLCACTRPAPYLSVPAIGRPDPGGSWILPDWVYACGWILLTAACMRSFVPIAEHALWPASVPEVVELAWRWFGWIAYLVPLVIARSLLPFAWLAFLALEILAELHADGSLRGSTGESPRFPIEEMLLFAAAFDPGWIAPRSPRAVDAVFYDGHCGLCHRFVRFLLAEDRRGASFRFAPLDSRRCRESLPSDQRANLPDSAIVLTADGRLLTRSSATRHLLSRLGGVWRLAAIAASVIPTAGLDRLYDFIARVRHRLFVRPTEACPLTPAHLRRRFDL